METGEYSFGYVVGWSGGGEDALKCIKASTGRIQRAVAAVLKTFEAEEPVVEAVNVLSAGVSREQWRDVEVVVDAGAQWRGYPRELARLYDVADASEGRVTVIPVELPMRDAPLSTDEPTAAGRFDEVEAPIDAYHELEI
jgi:hypothetical protein